MAVCLRTGSWCCHVWLSGTQTGHEGKEQGGILAGKTSRAEGLSEAPVCRQDCENSIKPWPVCLTLTSLMHVFSCKYDLDSDEYSVGTWHIFVICMCIFRRGFAALQDKTSVIKMLLMETNHSAITPEKQAHTSHQPAYKCMTMWGYYSALCKIWILPNDQTIPAGEYNTDRLFTRNNCHKVRKNRTLKNSI